MTPVDGERAVEDPGPRPELVTPHGVGGVAVVVLRGPCAGQRAARLLAAPGGGSLDVASATTPRLAALRLGGETVDRVLVVRRPDRVEIHLHGAPAVLAALERELGPFARERPSPADRLLREAVGEAQLALALEQRGFDWERWLAAVAALPPARRADAVAAARARSRVALALARPTRVVLCGRQNAGKSTLMNRLLFRERALAGATPGLTRDPVRELVVLSGYPYELVDTAGEGDFTDELDGLALQRARAERAGAVLAVVVDGSRGPGALELGLAGPRTLFVRTKLDLPQRPWPGDLAPVAAVACRDEAAAGSVRDRVGRALRGLLGRPPAGPVGGPAALSDAQLAALEAVPLR